MSLDLSRLTNVKPTADGFQARCPACAAQNGDKSGNHLRIWKNGAFNCIVGSETPGHNRIIRSLVLGDGTIDVEYIDPEPRLTTDKIYPESSIAALLPDYTYWLGRGMKESVLAALENGVAPKGEKGKLAGRTIFPVRDMQRRIMGFSGRLLETNSFAPTWKHMFKSSRSVYPWHLTGPAIKAAKTVVLVESVGDLLACLSHDIKPVLCIFGLNLNSAIISTLVANGVQRVILSLNNDPDPVKSHSGSALARIESKLTLFFARVEVRLPESKDWGKAAEGGEAGAAELARFKAEVES